ncbi:hypothetical protein RhiirA4_523571 [Rhizophagus irregularis]|uniref:Uncharacterized protein n=1 Tax=Rhizophagus irregularis TaxID=588596 RepID=A0A2I1GMN0_9GLOM|nr:hypothetical protein RhiirA4_523571 [Rhizophagus irregularis]
MDESDKNHMAKFSLTGRKGNSDVLKNIARLYEDACNAEDETIKANQAEILCWCNFIIGLDKSVDEIMIKEKSQEFIEKIGIDKIKYIKTYSANSIAELSDSKIQTIIDYFSKNPNTELLGDQDDSIIDSEEEISDDQTNASEVQANPLVSAEVSLPSAPIPLRHFSNLDEPKKSEDIDLDDCLAGITEEDLWGGEVPPKVEEGTNEAKADEYDEDAFAESIKNSYEEMLKEDEYDDASIKVFDDSSEDEESQNETETSSSSSDSESNSDSDTDIKIFDDESDAEREEESKNETPQITDEDIFAAFGYYGDIGTEDGQSDRSESIDHPKYDILREEIIRSEAISVQS